MKIGAFLLVIVIAVFQFLAAPPAGQLLGLDNWAIFLATLIGSVGGTVALVYAGDKIVPRLTAIYRRLRPKEEEEEPEEPEETTEKGEEKPSRVKGIVERHGEMGLGLVAPFTIGGFAGALMGVGLGLNRHKLALWLALSLTAYVFLYTALIGFTVAKT